MRLLLAGTHSGCGKTTLTLALMRALAHRGLAVAPFKVGPDYIDPSFHQAAAGRRGDNLDAFLMRPDTARAILQQGEKEADIAVIEGVMGYYDGRDSRGFFASTYEMAQMTRTPAVLTVDAGGASSSVAAVVKGFAELRPDSGIAGVIVNRVSGERHYRLVREAVEAHTGIPCFGFLRRDAGLSLSSRHLGLVPAVEVEGLHALLDRAARSLAETVDVEGLLRLAGAAPALDGALPPVPSFAGFRLGVALDEAFHFYYPANLEALRRAGMELRFFSPLSDAALPRDIDGLYLGGGFPEVFKERLSRNTALRSGLRAALEQGMPCYAECGGLMYLSESIDGAPMVGFLPLKIRMTDKLQRFGYVMLTDAAGRTVPAHSFHHSVAEPTSPLPALWQARRAGETGEPWAEGYVKGGTRAGYPHLHFADHPHLMGLLWGKEA